MDDLQYCYKIKNLLEYLRNLVLNLVINGWPSIHRIQKWWKKIYIWVLNLVINGWPSILPNLKTEYTQQNYSRFKPCYKWMTFNTLKHDKDDMIGSPIVLNLVINGWPSILYKVSIIKSFKHFCFKPCYKWMTFNTNISKWNGVIEEDPKF